MTLADAARPSGGRTAGRTAWRRRYAEVRARTLALAAPLGAEDQQVQSMPDASPTKWHLAHVSWFFETFLLAEALPGYAPFDPAFGYLFNSYYEAVGERWPRPARGLLSRPALDEVLAYRGHVDAAMARLIEGADVGLWAGLRPLLELGLHHEQQHQELILMDIKHLFGTNPLQPAYAEGPSSVRAGAAPLEWTLFEGGLAGVGHQGEGFAFDNEGPRHKTWLEPYVLASRLATCGEYLAFIEDGGYRRPGPWLSDGWAAVQEQGWTAPLYWSDGEEGWRVFTLHGSRPLEPAEPVCHLSFYEADAFARWSGRRLPTEAEWENACPAARPPDGDGAARLHPRPAAPIAGLQQMTGELWQWTASPYVPYPRYRPGPGAIGEYNGKFMSGQMVLRGGCVATPEGHLRPTYRNFFPPAARWAFSGVRLADDA